MFKFKHLISILFFSFLLIGTSFIKNQTRDIEKKIYIKKKEIFVKEKDLNEAQLDFYYLTSPSVIEERIEHLGFNYYLPIDYSKIFHNMEDFINLQKRFATQKSQNEKKIQKK